MIEILEARVAPATLTWNGSNSSTWGTAQNWTPAQVPTDGDTLIFPASPVRTVSTNNLAGLDLVQIQIIGNGYSITGNSITLTSGILATLPDSGGTLPNPVFGIDLTLAGGPQEIVNNGFGKLVVDADISLGGVRLSVGGSGLIAFPGTISGAGVLAKTGVGTAELAPTGVDNFYTGRTIVQGGILSVKTAASLGATGLGNETVVETGGVVSVDFSGSLNAEAFRLAGKGSLGAPLRATGTSVNIPGDIVLTADSAVTYTNSGSLTLSGNISEASGGASRGIVFFASGGGTIRLAGSTPNSITGSSTVAGGTLELAKDFGAALSGNIAVGGVEAGYFPTLRLAANNNFGFAGVSVLPGCTLDIGAFNATLTAVTMHSSPDPSLQGRVIGTSGVLTITFSIAKLSFSSMSSEAIISANLNLNGGNVLVQAFDPSPTEGLTLSGNITNGSLNKMGEGILRIAGNASTTATTVSDGTLEVTGTLGGSLTMTGGKLTGTGTIESFTATSASQVVVSPGLNGPGTLTVLGAFQTGAAVRYAMEINGLTPGAEYDRLVLQGSGMLDGVVQRTFNFIPGGAATFQSFVVPAGVTASLLPLGTISESGITYESDATGTATITVPAVALSKGDRVATFRDADGDLVTVKTTKGQFTSGMFSFIPGLKNTFGAQLASLQLPDSFAGAAITFTAKRSDGVGNGFVNVGHVYVDAADLAGLTIPGDLSRLTAGDGDPAKPAIGKLAVRSFGILGGSTQSVFGGSNFSILQGAIGKMTVKGNIENVQLFTSNSPVGIGSLSVGGNVIGSNLSNGGSLPKISILGSLIRSEIRTGDGDVGTVTIGGHVLGSRLTADQGDIAKLTVGGSLINGVYISAGSTIGTVAVKGDVQGDAIEGHVSIYAAGKNTAPKGAVDTVLKSLTVRGGFMRGDVSVGSSGNVDASIGKVVIGGDWVASTLSACIGAGNDGRSFTVDDILISGGENDPDRFATIASVIIKGQVLGTTTNPEDTFGIGAEFIRSVKIGPTKLILDKAPSSGDRYDLAPTGPSDAQVIFRSDVALVELSQ